MFRVSFMADSYVILSVVSALRVICVFVERDKRVLYVRVSRNSICTDKTINWET